MEQDSKRTLSVLRAIFLILLAALITLWVSDIAAAWRGYKAHGGEIVIWLYALAAWLAWKD